MSIDNGSYLWANNLAWILATNSDSKLRDGTRQCAARQVCEIDEYRDPKLLDTLAACWPKSANSTRPFKHASDLSPWQMTVPDLLQLPSLASNYIVRRSRIANSK